jgi:hypothetical protein
MAIDNPMRCGAMTRGEKIDKVKSAAKKKENGQIGRKKRGRGKWVEFHLFSHSDFLSSICNAQNLSSVLNTSILQTDGSSPPSA